MKYFKRGLGGVGLLMLLLMAFGGLAGVIQAVLTGEVTVKREGHTPAIIYHWDHEPIKFLFGVGMWTGLAVAFLSFVRPMARFVFTGKKINEP